MADEVDDLAGAAADAMDDDGMEDVPHLPGTNYAKVKFVGMGWETAAVPSLKEEVEFTVRGMVVGDGEEVMADGSVRQIAKVKVESVTRND